MHVPRDTEFYRKYTQRVGINTDGLGSCSMFRTVGKSVVLNSYMPSQSNLNALASLYDYE